MDEIQLEILWISTPKDWKHPDPTCLTLNLSRENLKDDAHRSGGPQAASVILQQDQQNFHRFVAVERFPQGLGGTFNFSS